MKISEAERTWGLLFTLFSFFTVSLFSRSRGRAASILPFAPITARSIASYIAWLGALRQQIASLTKQPVAPRGTRWRAAAQGNRRLPLAPCVWSPWGRLAATSPGACPGLSRRLEARTVMRAGPRRIAWDTHSGERQRRRLRSPARFSLSRPRLPTPAASIRTCLFSAPWVDSNCPCMPWMGACGGPQPVGNDAQPSSAAAPRPPSRSPSLPPPSHSRHPSSVSTDPIHTPQHPPLHHVQAHQEGRHRRQVRHPVRRLPAQAGQEDRGLPALEILLQLLRQVLGQAGGRRHLVLQGLPQDAGGRGVHP